MSLTRALALATVVLAGTARVASGEDAEDEPDTKDADAAHEAPVAAEPSAKQNLSGHDQGTKKTANLFEKDRFFVDKVDDAKTEKGTLIQGSLSSSSLLYTERGDAYAGTTTMDPVQNAAVFSRVYTELRLQTDFRHISGQPSRWDARADVRARVVTSPENGSTSSVDANHVQSGFRGTNEYDIRELWLFRSGKRTDLVFGRQLVPDLGGVKLDGVRFDYASSRKLTLLGFGGLYPMRGSRSLSTDYPVLRGNQGEPGGRFVGTGGLGAAYRTESTYGALGAVVLAPFSVEQPRVFVTSTGYYRSGSAFDVYHFALVDLYGQQGAGLTNLSAGVNYRPGPRLRVTASVNRVDVDTLAAQANAYLTEASVDGGGANVVQNETYFRRLATNAGRVGVSAGLGRFQRFELSTAISYRYRNSVSIPVGDMTGMTSVIGLQGTRGLEVWASAVDRRSVAGLRLGGDVVRTVALGGDNTIAFNRSEILAIRAFASRALANGHGEWEAEASYTTTVDSASGYNCSTLYTCYGSSEGAFLQALGNIYYRINRDWFVLGTLGLTRQMITSVPVDAMGMIQPRAPDPPITGITMFFRAAYRF